MRAINEVVHDLHPVGPNPHTLLTTAPGGHSWFSVLGVKGASFCTPVAEELQLLLAFERQDLGAQPVQHCCGTVLPQALKTPTSSGETLARDLRDLMLGEGLLLQYVDDMLMASPTYDKYLENTVKTLNYLPNVDIRSPREKPRYANKSHIWALSSPKDNWTSCLTESKQLQVWEHRGSTGN